LKSESFFKEEAKSPCSGTKERITREAELDEKKKMFGTGDLPVLSLENKVGKAGVE